MKKIVFTLILSAIVMVSCEQEENLLVSSEPVSTQEATDVRSGSFGYKCPLAEASLTPCGYGFTVSVTFAGSPISGSYPYTITDMGGTIVDSGNISDGMNTAWVLGACQTYQFEFWGSWCNPTSSVVQIATTDGCGGVFVC